MKRFVASLLSVALLLQAGAAFAASETLELPFGGPPPRSVGQTALLEEGDSSGLPVLLRHKKRGPTQAGGRWSGRQDAVSRGRAEGGVDAGRGGARGSDGPRGSRGDGGSGTQRGQGAVGGRS